MGRWELGLTRHDTDTLAYFYSAVKSDDCPQHVPAGRAGPAHLQCYPLASRDGLAMAATHPERQLDPLPEAERGALTATRPRCCTTVAPRQTSRISPGPKPSHPSCRAASCTRARLPH